jgi:FKBP-type peptidyl-prolyl cis-trans isomerase (trigger factor)
LDKLLEEAEERLKAQKMSLDEFLNIKKQSKEQYRDEMRPRAVKRLKGSLALVRFMVDEGLAPGEGQIEQKAINGAVARLVSICKGEPQESEPVSAETPQGDVAESTPVSESRTELG